MQPVTIELRLPDWAAQYQESVGPLHGDAERMRFVVELARANVQRRSGGPFAAAIFERESGRLVTVGVNLVTSLGLAVLHAEIVAIMLAQRLAGAWSLAGNGARPHELVTSCEPCAMCFGAVLWSGVGRLVCGATKADAEAIGFDEGPVFPESWTYLEQRGIEIVRGVGRSAARDVLQRYGSEGGVIYNG